MDAVGALLAVPESLDVLDLLESDDESDEDDDEDDDESVDVELLDDDLALPPRLSVL